MNEQKIWQVGEALSKPLMERVKACLRGPSVYSREKLSQTSLKLSPIILLVACLPARSEGSAPRRKEWTPKD